MDAKRRMDQLIWLVETLGLLELEIRQYEQDVASDNSPRFPYKFGTRSANAVN